MESEKKVFDFKTNTYITVKITENDEAKEDEVLTPEKNETNPYEPIETEQLSEPVSAKRKRNFKRVTKRLNDNIFSNSVSDEEEINLFGEILEIRTDYVNYSSICRSYRNITSDIDDLLETEFNKCSSVEVLQSDRMKNKGWQIVEALIEITVNKLIDNGFYEINKETFIDEYYDSIIDNLEYDILYETIMMYVDRVEEFRQQQIAFNQFRKSSRGRIIGGGFGLLGAMQGIATAGIINAATGAGYGLMNTIKNTTSDWAVKQELREKLLNGQIFEELMDAIRVDVFNVRLAEINFLQRNTGMRFSIPRAEDREKCVNILNNIQSRNLPDNELKHYIIRMIRLNPMNSEIYAFAKKRFPNERALNRLESIYCFD